VKRKRDRKGVAGLAAAYRGVVGAYPYAVRASDSRLFPSYVLAGGALTVLVVVLFALGLVQLGAETPGSTGGTFTFSRAFLLVVMLLVVAPLVAPVLLVARRHRRTASSVAYDRGLALSALVFVVSLYLALVISAPPELREPTESAVIAALYALPRPAGLAPPLLAVGLMYLVHRLLK
jgi:Tfp pilus assembly protein PilN